jgi:hypothetical protein
MSKLIKPFISSPSKFETEERAAVDLSRKEQERLWLSALIKDREESATSFEKPANCGVWDGIVHKYSDHAHFIYELLQNADDARATEVRFELTPTGLYFRHNGTIHFSVTNIETEKEDFENDRLGHLNAITGIGFSGKRHNEGTIGTFGMGFKAVFQYTRTPHIYDPNFRFKIERYIVPCVLEKDIERRSGETVFYFPFDHPDVSPEQAYDSILDKLRNLVSPTLFLANIKSVLWENDAEENGVYQKNILEDGIVGNISVQHIELLAETKFPEKTELLLFSRQTENGYHYTVGFKIEGNKLIEYKVPAFCFFPTKENTGLNFLIHAPFLLTDSRESIRAEKEWNRNVIENLADLAADCLLILRDRGLINDNIVRIIPYRESDFSSVNDRDTISFKPFFTKVYEHFKTQKILPAANGIFVEKQHAYWASDTGLTEMFSDSQLAFLVQDNDAHWIFTSFGKKETVTANWDLSHYIDSNLITQSVSHEQLIKMITKEFIEHQTDTWLHSFYEYLSHHRSYTDIAREKNIPIFLNQNGNAVPAFDEEGQLVLFLPSEDFEGYQTVKPELLKNEGTLNFISSFGVKKPSLRDEIYNKIFPEYNSNKGIDTTEHFKKFFRYFKECSYGEVDSFINLIKEKAFLRYKTMGEDKVYRGVASNMYYPNETLRFWFESKKTAEFFYTEAYNEFASDPKFLGFLQKLGMHFDFPELLRIETKQRKEGWPHHGNRRKPDSWEDKQIDGLREFLTNMTRGKSLFLWDILIKQFIPLEIRGLHRYLNHEWKRDYFDNSTVIAMLRNASWILNDKGNIVFAKDVTLKTLSADYDLCTKEARELIRLLQIFDDTSNLTEHQKEQIALAEQIQHFGLSPEECHEALQRFVNRKRIHSQRNNNYADSIVEDVLERTDKIKEQRNRNGLAQNASKTEIDIQSGENHEDLYEDSDGCAPCIINYARKIEREKTKVAARIAAVEHIANLVSRIENFPRYSLAWFKSLIELEMLQNGEGEKDDNKISIAFGKLRRDMKLERTLILSNPSRFIPPHVEELTGIRLDVSFRDGSERSLIIEAISAKEFSLTAKIKSEDKTKIDEVTQNEEQFCSARINVKSPAFLLEALQECYEKLSHSTTNEGNRICFEDADNLRDSLPEDIEFVFGPPGTGKTTYLAEKLLLPLMRTNRDANSSMRVLVVTPTNKAGDVLVARIMESAKLSDDIASWLVRFGTTNDEQIESAGIVKSRDSHLLEMPRAVVVTTMARFTYDSYSMEFGNKRLDDTDWDYIVIDEASMIRAADIV